MEVKTLRPEDTTVFKKPLSGAVLIDAELDFADLSNANLRDTHLTGAGLIDANLSGANLNAIGLTQEQLDRACGENVKLDPGLTINLKPCQK
jgi:uncharacterized protein YjbI with pentapeptide repeats